MKKEIEIEKQLKAQKNKENIKILTSRNNFLQELKSMAVENYNEKPEEVRADIKAILTSIDAQIQKSSSSFINDTMIAEEVFLNTLSTNCPQLTQKDKRLCMYLKMGFSNQKIASLSNIQVSSVEKSKYRLKQKLQLSPTQSVSSFLNKL